MSFSCFIGWMPWHGGQVGLFEQGACHPGKVEGGAKKIKNDIVNGEMCLIITP